MIDKRSVPVSHSIEQTIRLALRHVEDELNALVSQLNDEFELVSYYTDHLGTFAATTSAQLAGVISDETGTGALVFGTSPAFTTAITPATDDGATLGTSGLLRWSDLYMALGATLNFAADWTATHSTNVLTVASGDDIRMTTAGINSASVVTVGGTQTLSNKTLTTPTINTPTIATPAVTGQLTGSASLRAHSATAIPAGGTAGAGLLVSSTTNFGIFFGSGVPTLSAAQGSLYLRSDGTTTNNRAYINTNGSTTWTALTTAA